MVGSVGGHAPVMVRTQVELERVLEFGNGDDGDSEKEDGVEKESTFTVNFNMSHGCARTQCYALRKRDLCDFFFSAQVVLLV